MNHAVNNLFIKQDIILIDGTYCPKFEYQSLCIVKGDQK